ncbi:hypothetical protein AYO45_00595 [Gammaproteobacteria bacterium SCGC AG-212-F23]|nr:hypothetical protein AYO45_00595 [Gammaproteobacteria bacterium SCGC AG-212-F23]
MKCFVIDANVIIKWVFLNRKNEDHADQALALLHAIRKNTVKVLQPPHWLAEVIAVVTRLQPKIFHNTLTLLNAMEFSTINTNEIYILASELSIKYNHHLFDTLYHAVALYQGNALFITADEQYYKKANKQGSILRLADFSPFTDYQ